MVFVPLDRSRAAELAANGSLTGDRLGHATTPGLLRAHDFSAPDEDAHYTALAYAGVSALLAGTETFRMVLAVELPVLPTDADDGDPFGRVRVPAVTWGQVQALFADEPESVPALTRARHLVAGRSLEEVVDDPEVEELLDACDLLWFAPEELSRLPGVGVGDTAGGGEVPAPAGSS